MGTKKASSTKNHDEGGWRELTPVWVKFEDAGDTIEGKLLNVGKSNLNTNVYTISNDEGIFYFFGGAQLDKLLPSQVGNTIKVTYAGEELTKAGRTVKVYKVWARAVAKEEKRTDEDDIPF